MTPTLTRSASEGFGPNPSLARRVSVGIYRAGLILYFGAVFHDLGLTAKYRSRDNRFEIDSANAAVDFLRANDIDKATVGVVWDAIALHTTPEIPWHKRPEIALAAGGVEAEVLGDGLGEIPTGDRDAVLTAYPSINHRSAAVSSDVFAGSPGGPPPACPYNRL